MTNILCQNNFNEIAIFNVKSPDRIVQHAIKSYDSFIEDLPRIIEEQFIQKSVTKYDTPKEGVVQVEYGMHFSDIIFNAPTESKRGLSRPITPRDAKFGNKTYELTVFATINLWKIIYMDAGAGKQPIQGEKKHYELKNQVLGCIPIMVKSNKCHLSGLDRLGQIAFGEDPDDHGGYFIIKGSSKVLMPRKNNIKNHPIISHDSEGIIRCKFSSQRGDYYDISKYIVLTLYPSGALLVELSVGREQQFIAPFYVIYYLFESCVDKDIFKTIIPDYNNASPRHISLATQFQMAMSFDYSEMKASLSGIHQFSKYTKDIVQDRLELTMLIANILNSTSKSKMEGNKYKMGNETEKALTHNLVIKAFDQLIYPHVGIETEDRIHKLNHMGSLIRKMMQVREGDEISDRNSLELMAVYGPAPGLVTTFKSVFNLAVATNIMNEFNKQSHENPYFEMPTITQNKIEPMSLGEILGKILKAGNKKDIVFKKDNKITNRITTVQKDSTNKGAEISVSHSITSDPNSMGGGANDTLLKSRSVHASEQGVKCLIQSIEGESTGIVGQMAIATQITEGIDSSAITKLLMPELDKFDLMENKGSTYSQVFVNGKPIGTHYDVRVLAKKYRLYRRNGTINPKISICFKPMENGELHFYTHMGRLLQPLVVVYQNRTEEEDRYHTWPNKPVDETKIVPNVFQYILYNIKHAELLRKNQITLDELVSEGVLEWMSPNENMNIIAADSYETFLERKDDRLFEYTHLSIPIAQLSASVLSCTFGNHSQMVRTVYNSKFVKQTIGFSTNQYGNGFYTKLPVRHNFYSPLARTVTDNIYNHGATSTIVAIKSDAVNQEDSLSVSDQFIQHGKFTADIYSSTKITIEVGQVLANPDTTGAVGIRGTDYSHLVNGIPKRGTIIHKGMAIVGIVETSANGEERDRSVYHQKNYPMLIDGAVSDFDNGSSQIVKISHKITSYVEEGDKFGAKSGCKGVISSIRPHQEMPITEDGIIPEIIINPCAFPTRMVVNQIMEGMLGSVCAKTLAYADATMYEKYDEEKLDKLAKELGIDDNGLHIMYDGKTGRRIKARICVIHNGYQRLDKLAKDNSAVSSVSKINAITQQPEKSVGKNGGQRFGFMEIDTLVSHGCGNIISDILFEDSDAKVVYICQNCGTYAGVNPKENIYRCNSCTNSTFCKLNTTHASTLIVNNLIAMGTNIKFIPEKPLLF